MSHRVWWYKRRWCYQPVWRKVVTQLPWRGQQHIQIQKITAYPESRVKSYYTNYFFNRPPKVLKDQSAFCGLGYFLLLLVHNTDKSTPPHIQHSQRSYHLHTQQIFTQRNDAVQEHDLHGHARQHGSRGHGSTAANGPLDQKRCACQTPDRQNQDDPERRHQLPRKEARWLHPLGLKGSPAGILRGVGGRRGARRGHPRGLGRGAAEDHTS